MIMKITDFRIGNLLELQPTFEQFADGTKVEIQPAKPLPISSIHEDSTLRLMDGSRSIGCFSIKQVSPIRLTEQWLSMFGFVLSKRGGYEETKTGYFYHIDVDSDRGYSMNDSVGIKYVHQLQNLFFDLTNEELTIR